MTAPEPAQLLITGANGRVGQLLIGAFDQMTEQVVFAHRSASRLTARHAEIRWAPMDGPEPLVKWVSTNGVPQAMLVLAGSTPSTGENMTINIALAEASLSAARLAGIGRIFLASSSGVYGYGSDTAWAEVDPVDPPSPYGKAKREMELACTGTDVCALRIGNVAGADALLTNLSRPLRLDQFKTGAGPMRSYIGPKTLARVVLALARHSGPLPPILNVGTPTPVDMTDLAAAAELPVVRQPAPETAIERLTLDTTLLEKHVEFGDRDSNAATMVAEWRSCQSYQRPAQ